MEEIEEEFKNVQNLLKSSVLNLEDVENNQDPNAKHKLSLLFNSDVIGPDTREDILKAKLLKNVNSPKPIMNIAEHIMRFND